MKFAVHTGPSPAVLAAAAGDADTAARLAAAGVDVLVAYHSSVLRRLGLPSVAGLLPWASANELTLGIVADIVNAGRPTLATVCANDCLQPPERMLAELAEREVRGVLNAPTVTLLTGPVRDALEEAGLGFEREVELMALAGKHGMRACGYAVTPEQATALAGHGAEAIVVHLGITRPGPPTARQAETLTATAAAARAARPDVHLLVHGGPLTSPAAFTALYGQNGVHFGFFGASVFEHATDLERTVRSWRDVLAADRDGR